MSKRNEFDDLKGLPLDKQPFHKPVPTELKEVKRFPNPEDASINLSDIINVLWAHLRNKAITELNPMQVAKASSFISYGFIGLFLLILGLVIGLWL